jgi:hypothetical protein
MQGEDQEQYTIPDAVIHGGERVRAAAAILLRARKTPTAPVDEDPRRVEGNPAFVFDGGFRSIK